MTTLSKMFFITVLSAGLTAARAGQISGSYSNDCGGMVRLWDISGTYSDDSGIESETMTVDVDASGNLTGTGHMHVADTSEGVYLDGDYAVSGKVKSAGSVTRVSLIMTVSSGSASYQGVTGTFKATLKNNLEIDEANREMVGTSSGSLKATVNGVTKGAPISKSEVAVPLPDQADGQWGLTLNASLNGTKYQGQSTINLSNGKSYNLTVNSGTYSSKTDASKLVLKGADTTHPINLNLTAGAALDTLTIKSIKGKVMGQTLNASY